MQNNHAVSRSSSRAALIFIAVIISAIGFSGIAFSAEYKDAVTGMEFVFVKGGCYQMGDTFGDGNTEEIPAHKVCINDFYIGRHVVTQGQWKTVAGSNPSEFRHCGDNCPVEQVSWDDARSFIQKLNRMKPGNNYRLPTEAEWEYAARSGGKQEKHAGGVHIESAAWYFENSDMKTHPVGTKAPNGLGLYDMSGNVFQWCSDWDEKSYYSISPKDNPQGPSSGEYRVIRGGAWISMAHGVRTTYRLGRLPERRSGDIGLRLVKDVK
jgi:formylglycine-generating enzyme required for sulfatase activity